MATVQKDKYPGGGKPWWGKTQESSNPTEAVGRERKERLPGEEKPGLRPPG